MSMAERIGVDISIIPRKPMQFITWSPVNGVIVQCGTVEYKDNSPIFKHKKNGTGRPVLLNLGKNGLFKGINYF